VWELHVCKNLPNHPAQIDILDLRVETREKGGRLKQEHRYAMWPIRSEQPFIEGTVASRVVLYIARSVLLLEALTLLFCLVWVWMGT
jgi:hypothetical protein